MTPEQDIAGIVASVCESSGHWPYTRDAELYIGYRPGVEELKMAGDRVFSTEIEYDIVIAAKRGAAAGQMESLRYQLYNALWRGGWKLRGVPGPESYVDAHEMFLWPLTVVKRFCVDGDGQPETPAEYAARMRAAEEEGEDA